jgi:hypothetical protein
MNLFTVPLGSRDFFRSMSKRSLGSIVGGDGLQKRKEWPTAELVFPLGHKDVRVALAAAGEEHARLRILNMPGFGPSTLWLERGT